MPDITPERLLKIADEGLYQAKSAGRNTYRLLRVAEPPFVAGICHSGANRVI
ncbi:Uncharacterised protein [Chromobacterium violaceum]|uniref:GGDEF domain-containing protein n=1 Tax=Chromobacterium violaceum TaxID=536 RepID=A0A3S4J1T6_CHRVL|nr:Uncharacterised protein [Chromobacterium violaceum]